ncbi:TPR domain-containing protein [Hypoxylon sp. NC1633]|nr:TPR domain-containing protein [Hypoxylon sp. NC1633]
MLSTNNSLLRVRCLHQRSLVQFTRFSLKRSGPEITVSRIIQQRRHQSSSQNASEQKPPLPPSRLLLRAVRQSLSFGPLFSAFRGQSLRSLYRQSPEELVLAIFLLSGIGCICLYTVYAYFHYFQSKQFTQWPPEIAKSLRRALYYTNYGPDPKLAFKYYKLALEQCMEARLDPFSDKVLGLKIHVAGWFQKNGSYQNSIEVLEALLQDCKKWVEVMDRSVQEGLVDDSGRLKGASDPVRPTAEENSESEPAENLWGKRTRILEKSVLISVKLGQLYADEHVLQGDSAGEHLIWAVETVLKELQRRQVEPMKKGEGPEMTPEQIGGALEELAHYFESKSQHYLAAPLFLQAITLSPPKSCHTAVLMNNLAISLAQQPIYTPLDPGQPSKASGSNEPARPTRSSLLASARSWALQAQETAQKVRGEDKTDECDEACAVALCNLGDIAAMAGDIKEARRRFDESLTLSRKIAFEPGAAQAQEGLQRLSETTSKGST